MTTRTTNGAARIKRQRYDLYDETNRNEKEDASGGADEESSERTKRIKIQSELNITTHNEDGDEIGKETYDDEAKDRENTTTDTTIQDIDTNSTAVSRRQQRSCPYLGTINRHVLDFDFEKLCSVTLSNQRPYGCLVCGKFFQGK